MSSDTILAFLPEDLRQIILTDEFNDKITLFARHWTETDCMIEFDKSLFVFGDNDIGEGCKGQAVIRNCPNAIGIPTKKRPTNEPTSFYTDDEYDESCKKIQDAIIRVIEKSRDYVEIMFPVDGFGTGLARLKEKAPKTFKYLNDVIVHCFGIDYEDILTNGLRLSYNI